MREMRERIREKDFRPVEGSLTFSVRQVELTVEPEQKAEGFFEITADGDTVPEGFVSSQEERMTCLTTWFNGEKERIDFSFDARRMKAGQTRSGRFFIGSNYGEYTLVWKVQVREKPITGSLGELENLSHFVNLARANWKEAVRLFYTPQFVRLCGQEERLLQLYRGLSVCDGNENNVEEFLISAGKKQPVAYSTLSRKILVENVRENVSEELLLTRAGWGPVSLLVETEGDFFTVEKTRLTENDFLGSQCRLRLFFEKEKMHGGNNFGRIVLTWSRGSIAVAVIAQKQVLSHAAAARTQKEQRECQRRLVSLYQDYRMKKLDAKSWRSQAYDCVQKMSQVMPEKDIAPKLFYAQLLLTENKREEAGWILKRVQSRLDSTSAAVSCYYLYLTSLYRREDEYARRVALKIEEVFSRNPKDWRIAWLILFLSRQLGRSAVRKWNFLESQFRAGCTSPVLYLEALSLLNAGPTLLQRLDGIAVRLLVYGARNGILGRDLMVNVLYLIHREKNFDPALYQILKRYWEQTQDVETLQAICTLLIKGGKTQPEYHQWFLRGVEEKFRIARLYEHYMLSLDPDGEEEIPKSVQLYFAYQSNLDYEYAACLYAYMEKHRDGDPELYIAYRPQMEQFVLEQLYKGRINKNLAFLYQTLIGGALFTPDHAHALAPLFGTAQLSMETQAKRLVVVPRRQEAEKNEPVRLFQCTVQILDPLDLLFWQDEAQNRRCVPNEARPEAFLTDPGLFQKTAPYAKDTLSYHLLAVGSGKVTVEEKTAESYAWIAKSDGLRRDYRQEINRELLRYYEKRQDEAQIRQLLERIGPEEIFLSDREEVIRYLVLAGFYEKAYRWMDGMESAAFEERILMRLCSGLLEREPFCPEKRLTRLCFETAARGKYDEAMLRRLTEHYEGSVREMEAVKTAAEGFGLDTFALCERIIEQMLYTGQDVTERMDLLRQYAAGGGRSETQLAFLHRCAYSYLKKDQPIHGYMIQRMLSLYRCGEPVSDLCRVACVQYYANNRGSMELEDQKTAVRMAEELTKENKVFPALQALAGQVPGTELLPERTFVVYRGGPGEGILLHYRVLTADETDVEYQSVFMRHLCEGIYCMSFLLFPGESLQYYVTESEQPSVILDSGLQKAEESAHTQDSRYGILWAVTANQLGGSSLRQELELLKRYFHTDFCVQRLFHIQE